VRRARPRGNSACPYVTRGGLKLEFALREWAIDVAGLVAADFGCHRGGFTDCLLHHGARKVYAVDTAHGLLDWSLRKDPRVVVVERTNLIHWRAPEPLDIVVIDAGWTPQILSVSAACRSLRSDGLILSLMKPQYEVDRRRLRRGVLPEECIGDVMESLLRRLREVVVVEAHLPSPIPGSGGNREIWLRLKPQPGASREDREGPEKHAPSEARQ